MLKNKSILTLTTILSLLMGNLAFADFDSIPGKRPEAPKPIRVIVSSQDMRLVTTSVEVKCSIEKVRKHEQFVKEEHYAHPQTLYNLINDRRERRDSISCEVGDIHFLMEGLFAVDSGMLRVS